MCVLGAGWWGGWGGGVGWGGGQWDGAGRPPAGGGTCCFSLACLELSGATAWTCQHAHAYVDEGAMDHAGRSPA